MLRQLRLLVVSIGVIPWCAAPAQIAGDVAPGYALRISIDSISSRPLELAVRDDGAVWVLWYEAGRWINPDGSFTGPPAIDAGNKAAGDVGAHPAAAADGRWIALVRSTKRWETDWPLPDWYTETWYRYVTRPAPVDTIASVIRDYEVYRTSSVEEYKETVRGIRSRDTGGKLLLLTTRLFHGELVGWPYEEFRFLSMDKTALTVCEASRFNLRYDFAYVTYKPAGAYFSHTAIVSEEAFGCIAVMQHQKTRVDSGSWMVDRYRRNIARFDAEGRMQTAWENLDTIGLQSVDQSYQLVLDDTSSVWIFEREPGTAMLMVEEWTFDGRQRAYFLVQRDVRFTGKSTEYQVLRWAGGFLLVWTGVLTDGSTDVFIQQFDRSMRRTGITWRVNDEERGNQYGPVSAIRNDTLNTAWIDERDGTRQVYLRRIPLHAITNSESREISNPGIRLERNFPNPAFGETFFRYHVPAGSLVTFTVSDILGRSRKTLVNTERQSGDRLIRVDFSSGTPGVYIATLRAGASVISSMFHVVH